MGSCKNNDHNLHPDTFQFVFNTLVEKTTIVVTGPETNSLIAIDGYGSSES